MKILKIIFTVLWLAYCLIDISKFASRYHPFEWFIIIYSAIAPFIWYWVIKKIVNKRKKRALSEELSVKEDPSIKTSDDTPCKIGIKETTAESSIIQTDASFIIADNTIYKADGSDITDDDIPTFIELSYKDAIEREQNSPYKRTEQEEELSFQFEMNHYEEITKRTNNFESCRDDAYSENNIDKKIQLLQKVIIEFEKSKKWFYRTKGGTIYFQDNYERMHNSSSNCFSYIDSVQSLLNSSLTKKNIIIPTIIDLASNPPGILQKDIYKHMPDIARSDIQQAVKELEADNQITRTKESKTYRITKK